MNRLPDTRFDYVTVGHVTRDALESDGGSTLHQPGGSAFYSALQAARLGLRTLIVTQGVPGEIEALLAPYSSELELLVIPARHTTTLSTRGSGASRTQRVLAWAGAIVEPIELDTAILHLAPVARETPVAWRGGAGFVGITPQGLVRRWEQDGGSALAPPPGSPAGDTPPAMPGIGGLAGDVLPVELDPALLPPGFDAAVISEHEHPHCRALFAAAHRCGALVAVTAGSRPTAVHGASSGATSVVRASPPPIVAVRDEIGAGDVFAAAFFVALAHARAPLQAAAFANAAAAVRISGTGADAIASREQIEAVVRAHRALP